MEQLYPDLSTIEDSCLFVFLNHKQNYRLCSFPSASPTCGLDFPAVSTEQSFIIRSKTIFIKSSLETLGEE